MLVQKIQQDVEALTLLFFKSAQRKRETQIADHLKYFIRPMWFKRDGKYDPLLKTIY
jgi:hypothetical protein